MCEAEALKMTSDQVEIGEMPGLDDRLADLNHRSVNHVRWGGNTPTKNHFSLAWSYHPSCHSRSLRGKSGRSAAHVGDLAMVG